MGMTIEEAIKWIEEHHSIDLHTKDDEAHRMAIETMRKYQKIEEIVTDDYGYSSNLRKIMDIKKVVEE